MRSVIVTFLVFFATLILLWHSAMPFLNYGMVCHDDEIERKMQIMASLRQERLQVIRELAAHQLTLLDAAGRFHAINHDDPVNDRRMLRLAHPDLSDRNLYCLQVKSYASNGSVRR